METTVSEARAVLPRLFVGEWTPFVHVFTSDPDYALELIMGGVTVVVPRDDIAAEVMREMGKSEERIRFHLGT